MTPIRFAVGLVLTASVAAQAQTRSTEPLDRAVEDYSGGRNREAAIGFYRVEEGSTAGEQRLKAGYYLAQSLDKLGLGFGAFFHYSRIIKAGPSHPEYLKSIEAAVAIIEAWHDDVLGPNLLNQVYNEEFGRLPPQTLAKINYQVALLGFRAGNERLAERFLTGVQPESGTFAQSQYLGGLLQQRKDPAKAVETFRNILSLEGARYRDLDHLKEVTHLALGRTYYGLQRYEQASAEYSLVPRFSRHWDEALFEGAYADLLNGAPGAALGKLHSLHSPHLSDEFAPESENLAAVIYQQNCLYPQAREAVARFNRVYVPMLQSMKAILESNPPVEQYWQMVAQGKGSRLPGAVQRHLAKNERVGAMLGYLARLDLEAEKVRRDDELARSPLGVDLLDLIARQRSLAGQVAGKFIQGRLKDLTHLIEVLDGDKEIVVFETTKGEKEVLDQNVDRHRLLASQTLNRPPMPSSGHEYWPFDGEYWPDEIGYYRYTLKNACPPAKSEE